MKIEAKSLKRLLEKRDNTRIFTVTFIKRTTGEVRTMNAIIASVDGSVGVTKNQKGVGLSYTPKDHALLIVWDLVKKSYRSIALDALISAKIDGTTYQVRR